MTIAEVAFLVAMIIEPVLYFLCRADLNDCTLRQLLAQDEKQEMLLFLLLMPLHTVVILLLGSFLWAFIDLAYS